jgi:hypothetical protein
MPCGQIELFLREAALDVAHRSGYNESMRSYRPLQLLLLVASLLLPGAPAAACFWDSDTLAWEARAFPGLTEVITGRFPRNPPLYYRMRLKRAAAQIAANPEDFAAYDDAGASCDRLEDDDAAIAWMEKKRVQLASKNPADALVREHLYRYHANVGTFWAHRWLRRGADRERIREMKTARDHIAQGIAINPDAHFGREQYQLLAMEWILAGEPDRTLARFLGEHLPRSVAKDAPDEREKAVQGLSGLIVLGNAWESVDIFAALASFLELRRDTSLSYLAKLRCRELIAAGRPSLCPDAPVGDALAQRLHLKWAAIHEPRQREIQTQYRALRAEAEAWQKMRTLFMMTRLAAGHHPDTDAGFWNGWHDSPPPSLGVPWWTELVAQMRTPEGWVMLILMVLCGVVVVRAGVKTGRWLRRRRWKPDVV